MCQVVHPVKNKLVLVGAGGHCRSCIDVIEQAGQYDIVGLLDNVKPVGQSIFNYKIIGADSDIETYIRNKCSFLVTIGQIKTSKPRQRVYDALKMQGALIATVISPRAYVSQHAQIEMGTIVMHDALVNAGSTVGENCIVNSKALIEHDVTVEKHSHISTAAVVNGGVHVKQGTFFGSNAVSKEYVNTEVGGFVKAGSIFKGAG